VQPWITVVGNPSREIWLDALFSWLVALDFGPRVLSLLNESIFLLHKVHFPVFLESVHSLSLHALARHHAGISALDRGHGLPRFFVSVKSFPAVWRPIHDLVLPWNLLKLWSLRVLNSDTAIINWTIVFIIKLFLLFQILLLQLFKIINFFGSNRRRRDHLLKLHLFRSDIWWFLRLIDSSFGSLFYRSFFLSLPTFIVWILIQSF